MTDMFLYKIRTNEEKLSTGTWEICGYWSNISPIRRFFHDNVIKGGNPHAFYIVEEEVLDRLKLLCFIILMNQESEVQIDVANALLPLDIHCGGQIDAQYFAELERTHSMLQDVFEEDVLFVYREHS